MTKRRNPDDWFTGLTGGSRNAVGPTSNVVFSGYPYGYDHGYGNYGVVPEPRPSSAVESPELTNVSTAKKEPEIIILDDDTPPSSQVSQSPSSSTQPLKMEPSILVLGRTPSQQVGSTLQSDPSIVILDNPPPTNTRVVSRRLGREPTIEIVNGPTIAPPPAKRQRKAKDQVRSDQNTIQQTAIQSHAPPLSIAGPSSQPSQPTSQSQPAPNRPKATPVPQLPKPASKDVRVTFSTGPSHINSQKPTGITAVTSNAPVPQPKSIPVSFATPRPGPSKPSDAPFVAPNSALSSAPVPVPALATTQCKGKAPQASRAPRQPKPKAEKRLAITKKKCPNVTRERLERVTTQRFFMVDRKRVDREGELREEFQVLGSTGNVYTVTIQKLPSCNCPDALKGNHCKHTLFIYAKVLQVPFESHVWYQKALLSTELEEIFANAPLAPNDVSNPHIQQAYAQASGKAPTASGKKRAIEKGTECPICYEGMHGVQESTLTFCDTCGNGLHKECFGEWAKAKGADITCPFCRAKWPVTVANAALRGPDAVGRFGEPYLNLANAAGLSSARDTSTYYHGPRQGYRHMGYNRYGRF
ncbi:hypothetical protein BDY19DRAFT_227057 [Irpex rosettiformis]|uniref:Uncharacterized protein n=1 Tax=Irpex rosettiformis TaxID=378272 RepID=A0ACB8U0G6_9APHY|nr:hypothetical protein BDY19DRAFT_227057 [Irpex rosettiformis]